MPSSGETWNQFRLLEPLGKGGMGEVYLAEDESLDRKVALKFLPGPLQKDPTARERFLREARSAAALDHPYICKIYEIGEVGGNAFIAMEYVEGLTLQHRLAGGPMPLAEILQIGSEIAEAVEAAHKKRIVHRDLKAPNVMLTPDGHVKVMDFGLAKEWSVAEGMNSDVDTLSGKLTERGATPGTIIYMSPEQVRGEMLDPRSDVFSLGVLIYQMATGTLPFQGATSGLTYDAILNRGPVPPRSLNPELPVELEHIIDKALEKDRENRYQTAKELLVDLRRLKRDSSAEAAVIAEPPRATRTHRPKWLAAAAVVAVLSLLGIWSFWPEPASEEAIDSLAVFPFENTFKDPQVDYLADGIAESLINHLSRLPQLRVMARSTSFRYRSPKLDPQSVGRELAVGAVLTGRVVQRGRVLNVQVELVDVRTGSQIWGQQYSHTLADIVLMQNQIASEILDALELRLTGEERQELTRRETTSSDAYQAYLRGRFLWNKRTNEDFKKAIEFFQEARVKDPGYALADVGLADCYVLLGGQFYGPDADFPPGAAFAQARAYALDALRLDDTLGKARATLAFILFLQDWDWQAAEREFQEAIALEPEYATAHQWYALLLASLGRHEEAITEAKRGLELEPVSPIQGRQLGINYFQARRYPEAIEQLEKTLELDPAFPLVRHFLIIAYWLQGKHEEAIAEAEQLGEHHAQFFRRLQQGDPAAATGVLASLAEDDSLGIRHRVRYYALAGDYDRVFVGLERAFQERHPLLPSLLLADPTLDPIRSDPRFIDLLRRMGRES